MPYLRKVPERIFADHLVAYLTADLVGVTWLNVVPLRDGPKPTCPPLCTNRANHYWAKALSIATCSLSQMPTDVTAFKPYVRAM